MAVPPADKPAATGIRGIRGFDTDYPEETLPLGMFIVRSPRFDAHSKLEPWAWVAFSARGLPAESPSPRDYGQAAQDLVVLQPRGGSTIPMHAFWTWESSGLKRDSALIFN